MLQLGSKGPEVKSLQEKLIIRGYSVGSYGADGDFGQGTHEAVVRFQRDHGLDADGIVGPATMQAIDGSIGTTLLRKGDRGPAVKELQQKLIAKGYSVGSYGADGDFGQGTYDAVVRFQRDNGLDADGIVGVATWGALNGFSNGKLLKIGDRGAEVKSLQEKLIAKGYSVGAAGADGDFGQGTYDAVIRFQRDNRLDADGIVGPATWEVLNGFNGNLILKLGDRGSAVKELQEKLIIRGYSVGAYGADGDFGQGTHDAVVRFQRDNGLDADGVVGPKTMYALNANPSGTLLKLGSKGAEVRNLQERLISRGYSVGPYGADGDFGQGTHDAVVRFQRDNGLGADGVVGPATWAALGTNNTLLRLGSKGAEVKRLQEALIKKGYSVGAYGADGDFGQGTHDAVVRFQRANGLDPDGVVGPATWSALNGFNDWNPGISGSAGVKKFLEVAKSQIGVKETPVNITPYGAWYGMQDYWCAMFISWCANQSGILGTLVPKFAWCEGGANWYRNKGRFLARSAGNPDPGDILFFYNRASNPPYYHVGIVEYVSNGRVHTIEGNSDDAVRRRDYSLNYSDIIGYGRNGGIVESGSNNKTHMQIVTEALEELYKVGVEFCNEKGIGFSNRYVNACILDFLRQYHYNSLVWVGTLGPLNNRFINYVYQKSNVGSKLKPYIQSSSQHIQIPFKNFKIDLPHLAATTQGYHISLIIPDFWTGWGGDLATAIKNVRDEHDRTGTDCDVLAEKIVGHKDYTCSEEDILADIDSIEISEKLSSEPFYLIFRNYYNNVTKEQRKNTILASGIYISTGTSEMKTADHISFMMLGPDGYAYLLVGGTLGLLNLAGGHPIPKKETNACARAFAKYIFNKLK